MSVELVGAIIFGLFFLLLFLNFAAAFSMLAVGVIGYLIILPQGIYTIVPTTFTAATTDIFVSLPLFIFMAQVFDESGIGEDMYDTMFKWFGGLGGGLGIGSIVIGCVIAATTGLIGTATVLMGMIAYPEMMKRGYDKQLAIGTVLGAGILGPIIPPSLPMIIIGGLTGVSIGKLFMAGILPGLLAAFLFVLYIVVRAFRNPALAPALPKAERISWREKFRSSRGLVLPLTLVIVVLGGIYAGVFTPSEAGGVGAAGALVCAAVRRKFTLKNLTAAVRSCATPIGMMLWVVMGGMFFASILNASKVTTFLSQAIVSLPLPPWGILLVMLIIVFIEGMFIDLSPIAFSNLPIMFPAAIQLGFDPLWFVFLFALDCIIGFLTPPFGIGLFYFKGLKHEGVAMEDVYKASFPYVAVVVVVLVLCVVFPDLALLIPNSMIK